MIDEEFNLLEDIVEGRAKGKPHKHDSATNGIITSGECGYRITVETHTKHYKNGDSQVFAYYRCTKKNSENKCSQPYISSGKLEGQFTAELTQLELVIEFAELALEVFEKVKQRTALWLQTVMKHCRKPLKTLQTNK